MPERLWALGGVCRNFCGLRGGYAGNFVGSEGAMLELLWARGGGYAGTIVGLGGDMPELLWALGGVCRNFCGLRGGYAGNFVGSGGAMLEPLWARGGMPEPLWA